MTAVRTHRKQQLLLAAYELAGSVGLSNLTIEQVARRSGASKGIVHHYFASRDDLIEQTVRYGHGLFRQAVIEGLKSAASPSERLWSVVEANFAPHIFQPKLCAGWLSVFVAAKTNSRLARICEIADRRVTTHFKQPLRQLLPPTKVESTAYGLMSLWDGCWSLAATEPGITRKAALSMIGEFLRTHVPAFDMSVVKLDD